MEFKGLILDKFQEDAAKAIESNQSVMVSAPTGCGKTLVADYCIDKFLKENKRVIYTAPIKALSNQKYKDFKEAYGEDRVGILTGDVSINHKAQILVMTTEIYRNMLMVDRAYFDSLSYVVFDEIHYINDIERGVVWEESIMFSPEHIRFICLSATVPNAQEFADWIESIKNHKVKVVKHNTRVVPLEHFTYTTDDGLMTMGETKDKIEYERKYLYGAKRKEARLKERKDHAYAHRGLLKQLDKKEAFPAIYFVFSRMMCEAKARDLAKKNDYLNYDEKHEVISYFKDKMTDDIKDLSSVQSLRKIITKGIAVHHAGMLPVLKEIVEFLFSRGLIKILFATETFAVGINMPAKTVIFNTVEKYDGYQFRYLNSKEYFQIAGRAGRRGIDKFGRVISTVEKYSIDIDKLRKISSKDTDPIRSQFKLSANSVLNLMKHHSREEIREILKLNFAHYQQTRRNRKTYFVQEFKNKVKELRKLEYLIEDSVTDKGDFASNIYSNEVLITELFYEDFWQQFTTRELAILIAAIIHEPRRAESFSKKGITPMYNAMMKVIDCNSIIRNTIDKSSLKKMINFVGMWYDGCQFEDLLEITNLLEGDVIRIFRQILDYCQQIRRASRSIELDEELSKLMNKIDRDIVKVEF